MEDRYAHDLMPGRSFDFIRRANPPSTPRVGGRPKKNKKEVRQQ
jgi:hypothetical protein